MRPLLPFVAALAACLASCASAPRAPEPPLPFHVAVIPIHSMNVRPADTKRDGATDMRLEPDMPVLSRAVADALARETFTRVTMLQPDPELQSPDLDPAERDRLWVDRARRAGADLVLDCELDLQPVIRQETNGNFWLDFPLFIVGGPFVWFVKDRTYNVDVELRGSFYDLRAVSDEQPFGGRQGRVLFTNETFDGVDLNFLARADGAGEYVVSILIPSGFLAKEGDDLEKDLVDEIVGTLSSEFAQNIRQKEEELVRADTAPFYLDTDDTVVGRGKDGRLVVRGTVCLLPDRGIEEMSAYRLRSGEQVVEQPFGAPEKELRSGRYVAYRFEQEIEAPPGEGMLKLEIEAGSPSLLVRTYTFAVPGTASGG